MMGPRLLKVYLSEDTHRVGSLMFGGIEPAHIAKDHPVYFIRCRTSVKV